MYHSEFHEFGTFKIQKKKQPNVPKKFLRINDCEKPRKKEYFESSNGFELLKF